MWEYKTASFSVIRAEEELNFLGKDGWELVWVGEKWYSDGMGDRRDGIFKRRVDWEKPRFIINLPGDTSEQTLDTVKKYMAEEAWR